MKLRTLKWQLMLLLAALASALGSANAQNTPPSFKRIGFLNSFPCPVSAENPARRRLAELGWVEGKNFVYDCVSTAGRLEKIDQLAAELVARYPDVIEANPVPFVRALKLATTTIPIVMWSTPDPIGVGLVTNLARPEANVTGVAWFGFDIMPKRVELLREVLSQMQRLAIIYTAQATDPKVAELLETNAAIVAKQFGISVQIFRPAVPEDYDSIFSQLSEQHFDAAYIQPNALFQQNYMRVAELAQRYRVPTMGDDPFSARAGLLLGYGGDFFRDLVRVAEYIDKILRGAKPGELPVEQATKVQLAVNLKTARTLGLTISPDLLARADEVIE
jgi:putative ABC transport system substrate-binding protein